MSLLTDKQADTIIQTCFNNVVFSNYYKYCFYFSSTNSSYKLLTSLGGSSDTIYRTEISSDEMMIFKTLKDLQQMFSSIELIDMKTKKTLYYWGSDD